MDGRLPAQAGTFALLRYATLSPLRVSSLFPAFGEQLGLPDLDDEED